MNSIYLSHNNHVYLAEIIGDEEVEHLEFTHQGLFLVCLTTTLTVIVLDRAGTTNSLVYSLWEEYGHEDNSIVVWKAL